MVEAPIAQEGSPSAGRPAEKNVASYEEQLQQLATKLIELRSRVDRLTAASADRISEMDMKNDLAVLDRRIELLRDYIRTFEIERKIEAGNLEEAKEELDRLFVRYSNVADNDYVFSRLASRIRHLLWQYQDKLMDERHKLRDEISKLEDDVRETMDKILEELK